MTVKRLQTTLFLVFFCTLSFANLFAQQAAWQQRANYVMDIRLDVNTHIMTGTQQITYFNNSPDTLSRVFYHLYYNAFQPGSMMDERSRTIIDPDGRVLDRISKLQPHEIGYQHIKSLFQDGIATSFRTEGTILIVDLPQPILPGTSTVLDMEFEAQVPVQIRRTGRNNREGIAYSMAQWYPRLAAFDQDGWATHPYVAREFHGNFGDFDVRITIDRNFVVGGTGYLQNPQEIGHGYEDPELPLNVPDTAELTWHFFAPDVIDFMWGADPKFKHTRYQMENGPQIHLLYVERPQTLYWEILDIFTARAIEFINDYLGPYPYDQFTIIQGGDGGMEYPMATLITGHRSLYSLVGVTVHELLHMWFQSVIATNESLYHFIDEGFTVYMSDLVMQYLFQTEGDPHRSTYMSYLRVIHDQLEEPMGQHADWFETNAAYVTASYRKGSLFLHQLEYIVGKDVLKRSLQRFFADWQFRHPTPVDFIREVERESGMMLWWYLHGMLHTTRTIDLAINRVQASGNETIIHLENRGEFLMPVDLLVTHTDGRKELFHIPRHEMLHYKSQEDPNIPQTTLDAWFWTHRNYAFTLPIPRNNIASIEIDPSNRLADINRLNNRWPRPYQYHFLETPMADWNNYNMGYRPAFWFGEHSGIMAGARLDGRYLFNTKVTHASFMLTSGNLNDDSFGNAIDVNFSLSFRDRWRFLGPEGWWFVSTERYYGINRERLGIEKRLGKFGRLERERRILSLEAFHLRKTAERTVASVRQEWERGSLAGIQGSLEVGDASRNGIRVSSTLAVYKTTEASHAFGILANRTYSTRDGKFSTRFGFEFAGGSRQMPKQQRFNLAQGSAIERWENKTWFSMVNLSEDFADDVNLVFDSGNALAVYALTGTLDGNLTGNNMASLTIWNTYKPFSAGIARPLRFEAFAGAGRAWNGIFSYHSLIPFMNQNKLLASAGTGVSFTFNELRSKWTPQSAFLNGLVLSIRTPLYVYEPARGTELGARFMFGVSQRF